MRMLTDRMSSKATDLAHLSSSLSELTSHLHLGGFNNSTQPDQERGVTMIPSIINISEKKFEAQCQTFIDVDHEVRHHMGDLLILEFMGYGNLPKTYKNGLTHIIEKVKKRLC